MPLNSSNMGIYSHKFCILCQKFSKKIFLPGNNLGGGAFVPTATTLLNTVHMTAPSHSHYNLQTISFC